MKMSNKIIKFVELVDRYQKKFKEYFLEQKLENEKKRFKRENNREMEEDEIREYQFRLFKIYSFIFVTIILSIFYIIQYSV